MFDNLRDLSDSESPFYEEEQNELYKEPAPERFSQSATPTRRKSKRRFLGMTAQQRFIVAFMLMLTVCIMGTLVMFITDSMSF